MKAEERDKVLEILSDKLCVAKEELQPQKLIREDLGGDSLDVVDIVMEIEKEFNMVISDELYDGLKTVGDVISLINK